MNETTLYPLRFEPIYQYRIWGGRRLANFLSAPLPGEDPIGEAWVLSDRDDFPSTVADGPLEGKTLKELIAGSPLDMLGAFGQSMSRYPLLLKFLDACDVLSVQVHPSDDHKAYLPAGERGKTEAWLVLDPGTDSRIYAGLKPGVDEVQLRQGIHDGTVGDDLASFTPKAGDGIFLRAGTVHAMGGPVIFEVQQNSDVTFRLYDWGHVDAKTGKPRQLHIEEGIACTDFNRGPVSPVVPIVEAEQPVRRERLFECEFFLTDRISGAAPFHVGSQGKPTVLVSLGGDLALQYEGSTYPVRKGDVYFLPASVGACRCVPSEEVCVVEISLPDA
ncbi:MAG: class I mannose-6-phosphate isomerase [Fimbriimonas sp.]|nr:class I mannose-6-phosphate isomerase [Fimbriimonas sp.]